MPRIFETLAEQPPDALLALITAHRDDPRADKLDLGVGIYRDAAGRTPIFEAIRAAESAKLEVQTSKAYLGAEGDMGFVERLAPIVFGPGLPRDGRLTGLQTPGGTGALRLAAELIAKTGPARVWIGEPGWANHAPILETVGIDVQRYPYLVVGKVAIDAMLSALASARPGDLVLLQGASHNPSGVEPSEAEMREIVAAIADRGLVPFVDLAYQGLGDGLDEDASFARALIQACDEAILAYSCSKNFGLYRERTGALWVRSASVSATRIVHQNLLQLARSLWSMPPDHGAALVRMVLESEALTDQWRAELGAMRARLNALRGDLAESMPWLRRGTGLFTLLDIGPDAVVALRDRHGIYVAPDGRINIAGLSSSADVSALARAVAQLRIAP